MQYQFRKATREKLKARIALIGPSGSGKTYSALAIAQGLGERVSLIDTEHRSASKYAGRFAFEVLELESFAPRTYVQAIDAAARGGFDVLVIDSLSHAWMGKDGALEMVDNAAKRSQSGNTFTAWRDVTPEHNRLVEAMLAFPGHLIVTMRAKSEYILEDVVNRDGKTVKQPRKVGLAPIQRDGLDYEFDIVGDISLDHTWMISKTRCETFDGAMISKPGAGFASTLLEWLDTGEAPQPRAAAEPARLPAPEPQSQPARRAVRPVGGHREARGASTNAQATQQSAAAPQTQPRGACFSGAAEWIGADDWNGRQLAEASLTVLLAYDEALGHAIAHPKNKSRIRALLMHRESVASAIKAAEPPASAAGAQGREPSQDDGAIANPDANGGWDLSGEGARNDDLPKH